MSNYTLIILSWPLVALYNQALTWDVFGNDFFEIMAERQSRRQKTN